MTGNVYTIRHLNCWKEGMPTLRYVLILFSFFLVKVVYFSFVFNLNQK